MINNQSLKRDAVFFICLAAASPGIFKICSGIQKLLLNENTQEGLAEIYLGGMFAAIGLNLSSILGIMAIKAKKFYDLSPELFKDLCALSAELFFECFPELSPNHNIEKLMN